jgi:hypothetical protein
MSSIREAQFSNFGSGQKGIDDKDVVTGLARIEILRENLCTTCFSAAAMSKESQEVAAMPPG